MRYLVPLGFFLMLIAFLAVGLFLDPRQIPSPLIGKPAPGFELPQLAEPQLKFSSTEMRGKVWLLNIWASWCVSCRQEHPLLVDLAKRGVVQLYGINYQDQRADGLRWLARFGDPYVMNLFDGDGRVGIDYGVYGVPETLIIDKAGIVRLKLTGPLTKELIDTRILPLIMELNR